MRLYLMQTKGKEETERCFERLKNIIYVSLKSVQVRHARAQSRSHRSRWF